MITYQELYLIFLSAVIQFVIIFSFILAKLIINLSRFFLRSTSYTQHISSFASPIIMSFHFSIQATHLAVLHDGVHTVGDNAHSGTSVNHLAGEISIKPVQCRTHVPLNHTVLKNMIISFHISSITFLIESFYHTY